MIFHLSPGEVTHPNIGRFKGDHSKERSMIHDGTCYLVPDSACETKGPNPWSGIHLLTWCGKWRTSWRNWRCWGGWWLGGTNAGSHGFKRHIRRARILFTQNVTFFLETQSLSDVDTLRFQSSRLSSFQHKQIKSKNGINQPKSGLSCFLDLFGPSYFNMIYDIQTKSHRSHFCCTGDACHRGRWHHWPRGGRQRQGLNGKGVGGVVPKGCHKNRPDM